MKKRILSFLLVLTSILLAFSLTSCGMLEGIFGKEEKKELTFNQIVKNIEKAGCYTMVNANGESASRDVLAESIDYYASYLFDGELKKAAACTDGNYRIVVFECGSKSQANELRSVVISYDDWGGCYEVEKSFLLVANSYDIIEIALGERKNTDANTSTGSSNTNTSTGSSNTDSGHNHNTNTNTSSNVGNTDSCNHWYTYECEEYCGSCGEKREASHNMYCAETIAPTCIDEGYDIYRCIYCGLIEHANFTAPSYAWEAHSFGKMRVEPTCTSNGYERYACLLCGESAEGETIVLPQIDHEYVDGYCTMCGGEQTPAYTREGDTIYFGTYPQTEVTDSYLQSTLNTLAGTLPTSYDSYDWTSYGYYLSGSTSNYMWYIDIEEGEEKYIGVYFTSYRPDNCSNSSSTSNTNQDDNGYTTGNIYWFKYEPISWTILNENNGTALILCDMIIDSQEYYPSSSSYSFDGTVIYPNNYAYSTIRSWLNDNFYNIAFNELQKQIILTAIVDNSVSSTGYSSNQYACYDTEDKVFLLSYKELTTYLTTNASRMKKTTDYAQSQGAYTSTSSSYLGNGYWWLRSPDNYFASRARSVDYSGYVLGEFDPDGGNCYVNYNYYGVVPALTIQLD